METSQKNQKYWVILNMINGVGALRAKKLLERFGSFEGIFSASSGELEKVEGIGRELAGRIRNWRETVDVEKEFELAKKYGVKMITLDDEEYPSRLKEIYDPPVVLYVKGEISQNDGKAIAVVGTRRPSFYGRMITEDLSKKLAMRGFTIVSGMARGVDSAAHRGALAVKGRTIAVLGCGVDVVYPPENAKLMKEIAVSGAVISEFPFGMKPDRGNFPRRNRIISGLSLGVIVVEAAKSSGSLITANFALEQGREVFAVPGKIDSPKSYGTHLLIKEGAKLVQDVDDIVEELGMQAGDSSAGKELKKQDTVGISPELAGDEKKIFELLTTDPCQIDIICARLNMPANKVSSVLMMLEVKGCVKQLPGKQFVKLRS
jgi:DNA processing protein